MAVGRSGRKGSAGGARGPGKPTGGEKSDKASGAFGGKIAGAERNVTAAAGGAKAAPNAALSEQALNISRMLKSGAIKSKEAATKTLISQILREKVRIQSRMLTQQIADALQDDPRLNAALERLWSRTG